MTQQSPTNPKRLVDDGHGDLTFRIIGACMAVHNDLGPGHREIVYHRALAKKFEELEIEFEEQVPLPVVDEHGNKIIVYKPDFRVRHCVWLEIKAQGHPLTNDDEAKLFDYFSADEKQTCDVALFVNFGRPRLEWGRKFPPKKISNHLRKKWGQRIKNE